MGINIILPLIIGIGLMVSLGSQVVPSFVEQMKVAKIENRTISNQNLIKDAIVRYIKMERTIPKNVADLEKVGLSRKYHESNLFEGGYSFTIDEKKGTLKIKTTINDKDAGKYFSNNFKFPNTPTCKQALDSNGVCVSGEFETFYLLDEDTFKSILIPEVGSKEDILERFTEDNIGNKKNKDGEDIVFVEKDKDNFIKDNKDGTFTIIEKEKQPDGTWLETDKETIISGNNIGKETDVFISNLEVPYHEWNNETEKKLVPKTYTQEKVHCKGTTLSDTEVFVINENTGLGEIVWVAPNNASVLQKKIFGDNDQSTRQDATNIIGNDANDLKYIPNNICISNVATMEKMFDWATNFDQPLYRWDTSKVESMEQMFLHSKNFNQPLKFDTSNVKNMSAMFSMAYSFNQPLNFDTSSVTNMSYMFQAMEVFMEFNGDISKWNTSKVTNMEWMFSGTSVFNQAIGDWNTSNVTNMDSMFRYAEKFNSDIGNWDVSNVTNMELMFHYAYEFNQPLNQWKTSNVINMIGMFSGATSFNKNLSGWCVREISSKPDGFDTGSGFVDQVSIQPQWGTCPSILH